MIGKALWRFLGTPTGVCAVFFLGLVVTYWFKYDN